MDEETHQAHALPTPLSSTTCAPLAQPSCCRKHRPMHVCEAVSEQSLNPANSLMA